MLPRRCWYRTVSPARSPWNGQSLLSPAARTVSAMVGRSAALEAGFSRYSERRSFSWANCLYSPARLYGGTLWETMVPYLGHGGGEAGAMRLSLFGLGGHFVQAF